MSDTSFAWDYKQHMEDLSTWLTVTNANIDEVLQTVNERQAFAVLKSLDELNKYQALFNRVTAFNHTRTEHLTAEETNKVVHVEEQWQKLIEGSSELKKRYLSPESLLNSIENCLTLSRHLLNQQERINSNTLSDNNHLLCQLKACENEFIYLKDLLDQQTTIETASLLIDELTTFAASLTLTRIQLEMRIIQQQGFNVELESLTNWLQTFIDGSHEMNQQNIRLALSEREDHFHELTKCNEQNDLQIQGSIEQLMAMWSYLSSLVTDSPNTVTAPFPEKVPQLSSLCVDKHPQDIIDQARLLLTTIVQLGNRQEIERAHNRIQSFLTSHKDRQLPDRLRHDLYDRQIILRQMLIDTCHIDRLRVNFVAHFNTENNAITAVSEITTLIDNYPKEMTSQLRQWYQEQQRTDLTAPTIGTLDKFEEYLKDLEESVRQYQHTDHQQVKLKKLIEQIENLPRNVTTNEDKQRMEYLQARFTTMQSHIEEIRQKHLSIKTTMDNSISNINMLITRIKGLEDQIKHNAKQPVHDYERLIVDCQRITSELDQTLRVQVEQALTTGKRLYIVDNRDSSGIESADETGRGSPLSSPLKTRSDLTLRKVRRHVLQLTQHWKNVNNSVQHRLKLLQRVQTTAEDFRRKCDQLHAHLLEIELASVHKPQIKALNIEQIPAEIEQAKHLLTTLMSCKSAIDDVQQSGQTIEKEYDIQVVNRAQELEHRWEHSVSAISQRIQSLQESVKNTDSDIYSISVEYPWQRAIALNQIPYYINHSDQTTSWDHPKMLELMRSLSNYNHIRFSAYRTAMKLRTLQKRLCLDLTSLDDIRSIFEELPIDDASNKIIDIKQILDYLQRIFDKTSHEYPQLINVMSTVDLTLNWLLNLYDTNRTGTIRLLSAKMALALLCRGNIEEKYRYIFSLISYENKGQQVLDRQRLAILFQQAIVIPKQLGEVAAFGGSSVEPSVQSCFEYAHNPDVITIDDFLQWVKLEPQSLVWLPVMHRLAASEATKHEARCNICKIYPMLGFRYRSLRHFNCDICQNCFFSGKQTKVFKLDHPLQEYYSETTSAEDIRDFFRIFKNKLWNRQRKNPKLGYLPLPYVFENTIANNDSSSSPTPIIISSLTTPFKSESEPSRTTSSPLPSDDEHGIIAQHCKNLNSAAYKSPRTVAYALLNQSTSLNTNQRHELEAIIHDLEDENHLLQNEYERLCQEHMEKSLIINEHHEQARLNESSADLDQDRTMLREAKQLRQHKSKLEQRMIILEEHNKQLEKQLQRSKQLLIQESPIHRQHQSSDRQTNLMTIDNLFHMADDINRAVGDLVSVITEP